MGDVMHDPVQLVHVVVESDAWIFVATDNPVEEPPVPPSGIAVSGRWGRRRPAGLQDAVLESHPWFSGVTLAKGSIQTAL
jgi:hypothetical protein